MDAALRQAFTPEFLGRLDRVVHFKPLEAASMESIAGKYLRELENRVRSQGIGVRFPRDLAVVLGRDCQGKGGARQMRRLVQDRVEGPLALHLLGCAGQPREVQARMEAGNVVFC